MRNLLEELGVRVAINLFGDSSASQGTLQRIGAGKIKHLSTRQLWLQEKVYQGEVSVFKVPRAINWSDVLTHGWTTTDVNHFKAMGVLS